MGLFLCIHPAGGHSPGGFPCLSSLDMTRTRRTRSRGKFGVFPFVKSTIKYILWDVNRFRKIYFFGERKKKRLISKPLRFGVFLGLRWERNHPASFSGFDSRLFILSKNLSRILSTYPSRALLLARSVTSSESFLWSISFRTAMSLPSDISPPLYICASMESRAA